MSDPLQTIVQRMIDAGEPEENIATVIRSYKPKDTQPQPEPPGPVPLEQQPYDRFGRPLPQQGILGRIAGKIASNPMLQDAANPQSLSDISTLLVPDAAGVATGGRAMFRAAGAGADAAGRGIQAVASSPAVRRMSGYGAAAAALRGDILSAASLASASPVGKMVGRFMQGTGDVLSRIGARPQATFESPLALTQRLRSEYQAAAPAVQEAASAVAPAASAAKQAFSARDVVKIRLLMQHGLSQGDAIDLVKNSSLSQFMGQ